MRLKIGRAVGGEGGHGITGSAPVVLDVAYGAEHEIGRRSRRRDGLPVQESEGASG